MALETNSLNSSIELKQIFEYFQDLFEYTLERYVILWKEESKNQNDPKTEELLKSQREYHIDSVRREWKSLLEVLEESSEIDQQDILDIYSKLLKLNEIVDMKSKNNVKVESYVTDCAKNLQEFNHFHNCWKSEIKKVETLIALDHRNYGKVSVPKKCKIEFPTGPNSLFTLLEIGIDGQGHPVAIKHLKKPSDYSKLSTIFEDFNKLRHIRILKSYIIGEVRPVVITQLMHANLGQYLMYLNTVGNLKARASKIIHQIVEGLHYLHSQNPPIVHGNLKPSNIFIDRGGDIKIAEFGIKIQNEVDGPQSSRIWKSKEEIEEQSSGNYNVTTADDIFSCGLLIHFVISAGKHPFGTTVEEILKNIQEDNPEFVKIDSYLSHMLTIMLGEKSRRPNIFQVCRHIYWWPEKIRWEFVEVCCTLDRDKDRGVIAVLLQAIGKLQLGTDDAILCSIGGSREIKEDMSQFLWLVKNFQVPASYVQYKFPKLPLHLFTILQEIPLQPFPEINKFFEYTFEERI